MSEFALPTRAGALRWAPALLVATRPRQWVKGLLVLAAPLAAGRWVAPEVLLGAAISGASFTVTAAGCYLLNDVHDAPADRQHPTKRFRPIAAREIPGWLAVSVGVLAVVVGPLIAFATDREELGLVVIGYGLLTTAYTGGLKNVPGLELAVLASGFVLRPLAGSAGTGVPASAWFLGVCCAGALMVALGKRYAEIRLVGSTAHRAVLAAYRPSRLRVARTGAGVLLALSYVGWAATRSSAELPLALLSAAMVVAAVWRYLRRSDQGAGGEPERMLIGDPVLLGAAAAWSVCFLLLPLRV